MTDHVLRIAFAGTPEYAVPSLEALVGSAHSVELVLTQPDRRAGRGWRLRASAVKQNAGRHDLTVWQPETLKQPGLIEQIAGLRLDLMVVAAYGLLLPPELLAVPRLGCLNIHASLLPRWRGAAPIQYAILAGDQQTGITLMQMDAGLDTGAIIAQRSTAVDAEDTAASLHDKLARLGADLLSATLPDYAAGRITSHAQDESEATSAPKLKKAAALLDWGKTAAQLAREVRAFNPWPVSETSFSGRGLRVWSAQPIEAYDHAEPGTVVSCGREGIDVATADGLLRITHLQVAGRKPCDALEFVNAYPIEGQRLGGPGVPGGG